MASVTGIKHHHVTVIPQFVFFNMNHTHIISCFADIYVHHHNKTNICNISTTVPIIQAFV